MTVHVESNTQLTLEQERVYRLRQALERDGGTPGGFLELLTAVVSENTWKSVPSGVNNDKPFTSLKEFIEAKPPFGLGHSAEDVLTLLKIRHPRESVTDFRAKLDSTRAEVIRLLAIDGVTDYSEQRRNYEIRSWASLNHSGQWHLAFLVACHVNLPETLGNSTVAEQAAAARRPRKVAARRFAELANTSPGEVMRYYNAWEAAFDAGLVSICSADLYPGHAHIDLPGATEWANFYADGREGDHEDHNSSQAQEEVHSTGSTLQIAEGTTAVREAILSNTQAAEAARTALMDRLNDDTELQAAVAHDMASQPGLKKALAIENRRANQTRYIQKVAHQGSARTSAGIMIELPRQAKAQAVDQLKQIENPSADSDTVAVAYKAVHDLIAQVIDGNPDFQTQEQRSKIQKTLSTTAKNISAINPEDLLAVADDDLREAVVALQEQINGLATLFTSARSERD